MTANLDPHDQMTQMSSVALSSSGLTNNSAGANSRINTSTRRRGRRKTPPPPPRKMIKIKMTPCPLLGAALLTACLLSLATQALTSSPSRQNHTTDSMARHLHKRHRPDSQVGAEPQSNPEPLPEQHDLINHYDEPLALSSSAGDDPLQQQTRQNRGKRTLYACEEKQLEIECQLGESIQLIRANYGRFSIQICNDHGQLDWKVNCMSSDSYDIIARSCQAKQSCQLLASNSIFGDACPGTQKYLEVHYQCIQVNRTTSQVTSTAPSTTTATQTLGDQKAKSTPAAIKSQGNSNSNNNNVIAPASEIPPPPPVHQARPHWMDGPLAHPPQQQMQPSSKQPPQLPDWITDVPLSPHAHHPQLMGGLLPVGPFSLPSGSTQQTPVMSSTMLSSSSNSGQADGQLADAASSSTTTLRPGHCAELHSWRLIKWPETEAGQWAARPCPVHAFAAAASATSPANEAVQLYCQANGQWADHMQVLGRCQSFWLRNLTQRLDAGDSLLSILNELVQRTQAGAGAGSQGGAASSAQSSWWSFGGSAASTPQTSSSKLTARLPLFGEDLAQLSRVVGRLVEGLGELLARISDDKQRVSFAREMVQLLVELVSNLLQEEHSEAWVDLASTPAGSGPARQHVAGQLVSGLESAGVLLAGSLQQQLQTEASTYSSSQSANMNQENFHKITEHVYVAIQTVALDLNTSNQQRQKLQVTFPSQTSVLGTSWMNSDQRFTLNLQASLAPEAASSGVQAQQQQQQQQQHSGLMIVSVMLRGLGSQMEPRLIQQRLQQDRASQAQANGDSSASLQPAGLLAVNSDLVGFSIVADSLRSPIKVDLSAPIELVLKHNNVNTIDYSDSAGQQQQQQPPTTTAPPIKPAACVYWNSTASDWLPGGCKLVASNKTHSVCACDHLTTFALLSELDQQQQQQLTSGSDQPHLFQQQTRPTRVHLDTVEGELALFDGQTIKSIYMAKLLEGNLFAGHQARTFLYVSCSLSGLLLALLLAAAAYNRTHARRLLGSMPVEPPPSLLVANYHHHHHQQPIDLAAAAADQDRGHLAGSIETSTSTSATRTSPPNSYSSNGGQAELLGHHHQANKQESNILGQEEEMNGFYSLIGQQQQQQQQYGTAMANYRSSKQLNNHKAAGDESNKNAKSFPQLALVPIHLIVQLLLLQLLLLVLIESQSFLQWNVQQGKRLLMQQQTQTLFANFNNQMNLQQQAQYHQPLNPVGVPTWLVVFGLYYLASTLLFWLLAQLMQLNGQLAQLGRKFNLQNQAKHQKAYHSIQAISAQTNGATIYHHHHHQHQQQQPLNRYGPCQVHQQQQSSASPTLSTFSSSLAGNGNLPDAVATQHPARLEALESVRSYSGSNSQNLSKEQQLYDRKSQANLFGSLKDQTYKRSGCSLASCDCLAKAATSPLLSRAIVHLGPLATSCLLVWFTHERLQLINSFAYTSSMSSQLAYWPLVLNADWTLPIAVPLYCLPSLALGLGVLALLALRSHFRQLYRHQATRSGSCNIMDHVNGAQVNFNQLSKGPSSNHLHHLGGAEVDAKHGRPFAAGGGQAAMELASEWKRAKFVCLTLLTLLALNSICWISFFIHCHQAINQPASALNNNSNNGQQQEQQANIPPAGGQSNHSILTFASSNLLISLLICCSHRRQLRRACQLIGLSRFLLALQRHCCQVGYATKSSPASTSSVSSSSYYNNNNTTTATTTNNNGHQQPQQEVATANQQHHYGTSKSIKVSSAASQQSLFVISRSRPVGAEIAQPTYAIGAAYGPSSMLQGNQNYPPHNMIAQSQMQQQFHHNNQQRQQQHLYQQLANSQQHIYDSTTNLSSAELALDQQQRQLNALHLMVQQQQQRQLNQFNQQQQQPMINYTLGRPFASGNASGGSQFHLNHPQQQQPHFTGGGNMTLKPMTSANNNLHQGPFVTSAQQQQAGARTDLLMCPISAPNEGQPGKASHSASSSVRVPNQISANSNSNSSSSSGEADGPLVALAQTTTTMSNVANMSKHRQQHEFSIAGPNQHNSTPPQAQATFGPIHHTTSSSMSHSQAANQLQHTEHRPSSLNSGGNNNSNNNSNSNNSNYNQSSAELVIGHGNAPNQCTAHSSQTKPISKGQHNYTDALKAAMAQEASQQQPLAHFRRTNSTAMRQQQRLMIDAQLDQQQQQQQARMRSGDVLVSDTHHENDDNNNIYDVANCGVTTSQ